MMYSQTAEYSLRAMACLALSPDRLVSTPELANRTQVPVNYLAKVLQQLANAGFITGRRGVGGGYRLARPPAEINLIDIINAVDTLQRITTCPLGLPNHGVNLCPLHRIADQAAKAVIEIFADHTLADLLSDPASNKPLCDASMTAQLTVGGGAAAAAAAPAAPVAE